MRRLVFVHGRGQEHLQADALKREWVEAFRAGLAKSGLDLPVPERDIRFPYYGQTLFDLVAGAPPGLTAPVVVRGRKPDVAERAFSEAVVREMCERAGVTEEAIAAEGAEKVVTRGAANFDWVHRALRVLDRRLPFSSGSSIALLTKDVHRYLRYIGVRDQIDIGVRQALEPGVPTVVVSHSLGTIVSYSVLRRDGATSGWVVPLFVTLGSPLAVTAIKDGLAPSTYPECVTTWFNALDERDVIALYPLTREHFPVDPEIENKTDVRNHTDNRHGIAGYLDDPEVAKRIYDALVA